MAEKILEHNGKQYYKYGDHLWGVTLDVALANIIYESVTDKKLYYMNFNDVIIYSDEHSLNSLYQESLGMDYIEYQAKQKEIVERSKEIQKEREEHLPERIQELMELGVAVVDDKYCSNKLEEIVKVSAGGMYNGWELEQAFEIIKWLNAGTSFKKCKDILDAQGHSGWSHGLTAYIVSELCDRGKEFCDFVTNALSEKI